MILKFKKLNPEAIIPSRGTKYSAGLDINIILPDTGEDMSIVNHNMIFNGVDWLKDSRETITVCNDKKGKHIDIPPHCTILVPTGLAVEPSRNDVALLLYPRSGLSVKQGLVLANNIAVIDSDYRGEIKIPLHNYSNNYVTIYDKDRVAQLVVTPILFPEITTVENLSDTDRNSNGFGSTGVRNIKNEYIIRFQHTIGFMTEALEELNIGLRKADIILTENDYRPDLTIRHDNPDNDATFVFETHIYSDDIKKLKKIFTDNHIDYQIIN